MKKILYYAAMALAASFTLLSCEGDKPNDDGKEDNGGGTTQKTRLATPEVSLSFDDENEPTALTVTWNAIENAASYNYRLNDGANTNTTETTATIDISSLGAGTHRVYVVAVADENSNYMNSYEGQKQFTLEEKPLELTEPIAELQPYLGTYTLTSTQTLAIDVNAEQTALVYTLQEEAATRTVTIMQSYWEDAVFILGLSGFSENAPALATLFEYTPEGSTEAEIVLGMVTEDYQVAEDNSGNKMAWLPICQFGAENDFGFVTGTSLSFMFRADGNTGNYNASPYTGTLTDGSTFSVVATDIFGITSDNRIGTYYETLPVYLPAGEFTLVRTGDGTTSSVSRIQDAMILSPMVRPASSFNTSVVAR